MAFIHLDDETLRDGLQAAGARNPEPLAKAELLIAMAEIGVSAVNLGLPGAGEDHARHTIWLLRFLQGAGLGLEPNVACRTVTSDVFAAARARDATGVDLFVNLFIGCSRIRRDVEGWSLDHVMRCMEQSFTEAGRLGLRTMFVTEDTTRTHPEDLTCLYRHALDLGAERLAICDTCGHATPPGARRVVQHVLAIAKAAGHPQVPIAWHGHRDRGLEIPNALAAAAAGATRLHGTCLGLGERSGNAPLELLLLHAETLGRRPADAAALRRYIRSASHHLGLAIPHAHPLFAESVGAVSTFAYTSTSIEREPASLASAADMRSAEA